MNFCSKKVAQCRKKLKGGPFEVFQYPSVAKHQKIEGGFFGGNFFEKSLKVPKKLKEGPFSLSRYCMLRGKRGKLFLVQFASQMLQFGTIQFRRTFKNYFGQFAWIEKSHDNSRVSLYEAPTDNIWPQYCC